MDTELMDCWSGGGMFLNYGKQLIYKQLLHAHTYIYINTLLLVSFFEEDCMSELSCLQDR